MKRTYHAVVVQSSPATYIGDELNVIASNIQDAIRAVTSMMPTLDGSNASVNIGHQTGMLTVYPKNKPVILTFTIKPGDLVFPLSA